MWRMVPFESVWRPRRVFLTYKGRTVYHSYEKDQWEAKQTWHFTQDPEDGSAYDFDVRKLATAHNLPINTETFQPTEVRKTIKKLIDLEVIPKRIRK